MSTLYDCVVDQHDWRLLALAVLLCVIASVTTINLLHHARQSTASLRLVWIAVSSICTGFGVWATHFVAMLAFSPAGPSGYNIILTIASLIVAILMTAAGFSLSLIEGSRTWPALGGIVCAFGIAAMHYTGMGALEVQGSLKWDYDVVAGSISVGVSLGALIFPLGLHGNKQRWRLAGAAMLTLTICALHFVGMSALTIVHNPAVAISPLSVPAGWLAIGVSLVSFCIVALALTGVVLDVRDRTRSEAAHHIRYLADHDTLTTLPNRSHFNAHLDAAIAALRPGQKCALLCIDLDRFKQINDLFGHAAGDKVLQATATRISALLGPGDVMARLGGDEFAVLIPDIADSDRAGRLAEQIPAALCIEDGMLSSGPIHASIGIALCPDDATDREALLACADMAMYNAKSDGAGVHRFFSIAWGEKMRDRSLMEHELRHATALNQMTLVYQSQEGHQRGRAIGFEALIRWTHPTRGNVRPDIFIPIAEESGSILEIGEWVLRTACSEAASWDNPLTVAVNVSAVQLYHESFVKLVHEVLIQTGLPAPRLELEVTETALVRDLPRTLAALRRIKALGVRIAMDDFGTGYSSLSALCTFPFDKIKIDRSFISGVNSNSKSAAVVRAVLTLCRGLDLAVLAEGVETEAEWQFLVDQQCDEMQGYLLGRPASVADVQHITHANPASRGLPLQTRMIA